MAIDLLFLRQHRDFENPAMGYREVFLQPTIGSGQSVAVLTLPLCPPASTGFVICHSFGMEQIHLGRLDALAARQLAAAGFPTLRYHGQGYGDSEGAVDAGGISLASHMADASDAVDVLISETGVLEVGAVGARFGGFVAGLLAARRELAHLVLWEPAIKGSQFARDLLRTRLLARLAGDDESASPRKASGGSEAESIKHDMQTRG